MLYISPLINMLMLLLILKPKFLLFFIIYTGLVCVFNCICDVFRTALIMATEIIMVAYVHTYNAEVLCNEMYCFYFVLIVLLLIFLYSLNLFYCNFNLNVCKLFTKVVKKHYLNVVPINFDLFYFCSSNSVIINYSLLFIFYSIDLFLYRFYLLSILINYYIYYMHCIYVLWFCLLCVAIVYGYSKFIYDD